MKWTGLERVAVEDAIYAGAESVDPEERSEVVDAVLEGLRPHIEQRDRQTRIRHLRELADRAGLWSAITLRKHADDLEHPDDLEEETT